jgi:hypothetical protein
MIRRGGTTPWEADVVDYVLSQAFKALLRTRDRALQQPTEPADSAGSNTQITRHTQVTTSPSFDAGSTRPATIRTAGNAEIPGDEGFDDLNSSRGSNETLPSGDVDELAAAKFDAAGVVAKILVSVNRPAFLSTKKLFVSRVNLSRRSYCIHLSLNSTFRMSS